jgi:hypothetical protein
MQMSQTTPSWHMDLTAEEGNRMSLVAVAAEGAGMKSVAGVEELMHHHKNSAKTTRASKDSVCSSTRKKSPTQTAVEVARVVWLQEVEVLSTHSTFFQLPICQPSILVPPFDCQQKMRPHS